MLWEERGLSNRFPVSTAQSLRHHSIVCFTTQFFRHCRAARRPPLCRRGSADDTPEKESVLPGFKISVDVVWVSSPQHLSVLSSRLLRIFLSQSPGPPPSLLSPDLSDTLLTLPCLFSHSLHSAVPPVVPSLSSQDHMSISALYNLPNMSSHGMQAQNTSPVKSYLDGFVIVTTLSISINLSPNPLYGYQTLIYLAFNPSRILLTLPKYSGIHRSCPAPSRYR